MRVKSIFHKVLGMNKRQELTFALIAILIGTFVFLLNSPLHPLVQGCAGTDSSVFKTIALMMEKGYMPYRDTFDHKGPLLYILNYLGNMISYYSGIWVIEYVFLCVTLLSMYLMARFFCNIWLSVVTLFASMILLCTYFESGNLVEEYAMMFIAVSLYVFIDWFGNGKITNIRLMVCGAAFAGTLLLRPNMIALWIVMCIAALIKKIRENDISGLLRLILWFVLGLLIISVPIIIWLYKNNAIQSCWEGYILFNQQYSSSKGGRATFTSRAKSFIHFAFAPAYLTLLMFQLILCVKRKTILDIAYFFLMIITPLFICISGMSFNHYGMIMVPIVVYPLANIFYEINSNVFGVKIKRIMCTLGLAVIVGIGSMPYAELGFTILSNCANSISGNNISKDVNEICMDLDQYGIGENEPISVYGNWDIIYVLSKRPHATKYSYQFPIGQVMPSIMYEYMTQLNEELPRAIVVEAGRYDENISYFLKEHNYLLVWSNQDANSKSNISNLDAYGALLFIKQ